MELELVPKDDDRPEDKAGKREEEMFTYTGPERRKGERRQLVDRRAMVRFGEKADRRSGMDRRRALGLWKQRDF